MEKQEVRFPAAQVRILKALSKGPMEGDKLTKAANLSTRAWLSEYLGTKESAHGGFIFRKGKATSIKKLIPAGLVSSFTGGELVVYDITKAGRKKLATLEKAGK